MSSAVRFVAGLLGVHLGLIPPENHAALVAAGLVSVIVFVFVLAAVSVRLLRRREP